VWKKNKKLPLRKEGQGLDEITLGGRNMSGKGIRSRKDKRTVVTQNKRKTHPRGWDSGA